MRRRFAIILGGGRSARMGRDKRALKLDGRSLLALAVEACTGRDLIVAVTPDLPDDVGADRVACTLEDPPFGGPVAGIAAGIAALPSAHSDDEVLLLACDLPRVAEIVAVLDAVPLADGVEAAPGCGVSTSSTGGGSSPDRAISADRRSSTEHTGPADGGRPAGAGTPAGKGLDRLDRRGRLDCVCLVDAEQYPQYLAARYRRTALEARLVEVGETRAVSVRRLMRGLSVRGILASEIAVDIDTPDEASAAGIS
ncbi:MAG: NTP transferase domain-containing protein [Micropruina sp.]